MAKKINIKAPVAYPGSYVDVRNYRRGGHWENGKVVGLKLDFNNKDSYSYQYRIMLLRKSIRGNLLFLYVGCDAVIPFPVS